MLRHVLAMNLRSSSVMGFEQSNVTRFGNLGKNPERESGSKTRMDERLRPSILFHCLQTRENEFLSSGSWTHSSIDPNSSSPNCDMTQIVLFLLCSRNQNLKKHIHK